MEPRVAVARSGFELPAGTFSIGREAFPQFTYFARLGVHVQSDQVIVANPDARYVETALAALAEACRQLGVTEATIAFVATLTPPPATGLRYGFKGAYTTDRPNMI